MCGYVAVCVCVGISEGSECFTLTAAIFIKFYVVVVVVAPAAPRR